MSKVEFDYKTRKALTDQYREKWNKLKPLKRKLLNEKHKELIKEIVEYGERYQADTEQLNKLVDETSHIDKLSKFMQNNHKVLVELFVPKEYQEDYYGIIDQFSHFQYAGGPYRRTVRTGDYRMHIKHAFFLLSSYRTFGIYHCSIGDYLRDKLSEELLDFKHHQSSTGLYMRHFDEMLAARINAGDNDVIEAVQEVFLSENNTVLLTSDIIRAVVKSENGELHQLLCRFLVAAKLQEGIRQVICENADCGTPEAFLAIMDTIAENNLLRFAAVKRAVATWTGICNVEHMDRITDKVFQEINTVVRDKDMARQLIETNDSVQIMIGLWTLGFYEVNDAVEAMQKIIKEGSRNQILTVSYYNLSLQKKELVRKAATAIYEKYPKDYEMLAAFLPTYIPDADWYVRQTVKDMRKKEVMFYSVPVSYLFDSEKQARAHFQILQEIYKEMPKKKMEFSPCVFPWYGVELTKDALMIRMALIAYALKDHELIDQVCDKLADVNVGIRSSCVGMLLHKPETETQRKALVSYVADKESYTRDAALMLLKEMKLSEEEYFLLEGFLKYKTESLRSSVLQLLQERDEEGFRRSVKRLLSSDMEEIRLGGLDLLKNKKEKEKSYDISEFQTLIDGWEQVSEKEQILVDELTGDGTAGKILNQEGYGLYSPSNQIEIPEMKLNTKILEEYFNVPRKEMDRIFLRLTEFLDAHAKDEYVSANGQEMLLGNGLQMINYEIKLPLHERYPFPELWREFYEKEIKDTKTLMNLSFVFQQSAPPNEIGNYEIYLSYEKQIFHSCASDYEIPDKKYVGYEGGQTLYRVIQILQSMYDAKLPREVGAQAISFMAEIPKEARWYEHIRDPKVRFYIPKELEQYPFTGSARMDQILNSARLWDSDEEFKESFWLLYRLDRIYEYHKKINPDRQRYSKSSVCCLNIYYYIKAYTLGLIPEEEVYRATFEDIGVVTAVSQLDVITCEEMTLWQRNQIRNFLDGDGEEIDRDSAFIREGTNFYQKIVDTILDVELKRGDTPTVFSEAIRSITKIHGMDRLMAILKALGKSTLDRKTYYYFSTGVTKKECLSHLLQVCYPKKGDNAKMLADYMKGSSLKEDRLIETAMYAPQWLDIVEEYLNCKGFKSGCYYFMAHMNERFDDKKKAMIAKYTPLTPEELNDGCFDVKWFYEAHEKLGEKMFGKLYASAKYISDGSKHSRARKYADAALNQVTVSELEAQIDDKRNKDLLMSYGIIPVKDKQDILHRYEYLQRFLKESKQFGAQRKASEAKAVETAMKNLATTAGYSDETRLVLAMETALVKENEAYFSGNEIEGYQIKLLVDNLGKTEVVIEKDGKRLKTIPAALKKQEDYLTVKEFATKLKNQYQRTVKMFENSMEERDLYSFDELRMLCENPVTRAIICNLVWIQDEAKKNLMLGVMDEKGLIDATGKVQKCKASDTFRVAHPYDLYQHQVWSDYQKLFFERLQQDNIKQPFKQVFRELYVKLPEELEHEHSMLFAGNQIQPKKTVATLGSRRWVADYEDGLQKVYYKDNIIATIYALADWFSPADVEEPTLEYVVFYDRKNFKQLKIKEIPDIIYSEVMRDTDLAVSVAHVGGVDPEASHSTVEMRKVIFQWNIQLFKLDNVSFEKNHALIKGKYGEYSIHLGSGVIHKIGGHQINVLPVHSQKRGKIFLPFVDDDPKTAEIMSKILLFAEDGKIKDPYIMDQIQK